MVYEGQPTELPHRAKHGGKDATGYYDTETGEFPTEEELHSLRRVPGHVPWKAFALAFVELCERFSYYGTTVVCKLKSIVTDNLSLTIASHQLHPTTTPEGLSHWSRSRWPIRGPEFRPASFNWYWNFQSVLGLRYAPLRCMGCRRVPWTVQNDLLGTCHCHHRPHHPDCFCYTDSHRPLEQLSCLLCDWFDHYGRWYGCLQVQHLPLDCRAIAPDQNDHSRPPVWRARHC